MLEKKEFLVKLGLRVKALRVEKGLTQKELAFLVNKDQQQVNRLESGSVSVTAYFLAQIAEALNVKLDDLVF